LVISLRVRILAWAGMVHPTFLSDGNPWFPGIILVVGQSPQDQDQFPPPSLRTDPPTPPDQKRGGLQAR
jgi:hypothetical protein